MPDVLLYAGEGSPNDVRLRDPTTSGAGAPAITGTADVVIAAPSALATGAQTFTGAIAYDSDEDDVRALVMAMEASL